MARTRTTKKLAQRIDLNYFKRPTPLKRAKFWLSLLLPLLALIWIAWRGFTGDHRVYSSGRMSEPHAVLENECAACHVQKVGAFSAKAADNACLDCHDGPIHHAQTPTPPCATCHTEHRGRINIAAASNQACAECHSDLGTSRGATQYASHIHSFEDGHPEFAALRSVAGLAPSDSGTIKLNHAIHMKPIRRSPNGPDVQLQCGNCHHTAAAAADLTYSDPSYRAAKVSYKESDEGRLIPPGTLHPPKPLSGRELMAPVRFADACAGCHSLAFDKHFDFGVPHDKPQVVREFLQKKFQEYVSGHPDELRVARDPDRDLTGKMVLPEFRILTPAQWVTEQTDRAEELLWRKTCSQCHAVMYTFVEEHRTPEETARWRAALESKAGGKPLPQIAYALTTVQWMPHAKFDHGAHEGFTCVSCHAKALTSTESSDVLLPGIETCKTCHAPGPEHAESRCFECHTYHDWSKRKEVTPKFALPALRTGTR